MQAVMLDAAPPVQPEPDDDGASAPREIDQLRAHVAALESIEPLPEEAGAANADLGRLLRALGDDDGAVLHLVRAVFILEKARSWNRLYATLNDLAALHRARGEGRWALVSRLQAGRLRADIDLGKGPRQWMLIEVMARHAI